MFAASVITPTHRPSWLRELAWSLVQQTRQDFEWVILANGECTSDEILNVLADVPASLRCRTRVSRSTGRFLDGSRVSGVGAVKREAFLLGEGRCLIEVDHDDLLAPEAVEHVCNAIDAGADFVYSNMAPFVDGTWAKGSFWPGYMTTRPVRIFGRDLEEGVAHSFHPHTPLVLFHAGVAGPQHVRAWRRETYLDVGPHDTTFTVMDDMELIVRTYLGGARVRHLDECLYLYRLGAQRTSEKIASTFAANTEFQRYFSVQRDKVLAKWMSDRKLNAVRNIEELWEIITYWRDHTSIGLIHVPELPHGDSMEPHFTLTRIFDALVHGGWLIVEKDPELNVWDVQRFTRPKRAFRENQVERFQEITISIPSQPPYSLHVELAADKQDPAAPIPMGTFFDLKANEADVALYRPMFRDCGAGIETTPEGRIDITDGDPAIVRQLIPIVEKRFPGLVTYHQRSEVKT